MADSNNKHAAGFLSDAFGVAKKLSTAGVSLLNHAAPDSVSRIAPSANYAQAIEGAAQPQRIFASKSYEHPQQVLREHLPNVSRQLLGRHYSRVNNVAHFVPPQLSEKISDYLFEQLNQFSSSLSSVDDVLDQAGVRDLEELTQDAGRSRRAFELLTELQKRAEPFDLQTGLKLYENMVCTSIRTSQDKDSSGALLFTAELREVIIVYTQVVTYPPRKPGATKRQAGPKKDKGEQQGKEVTSEAQKEKLRESLANALGVGKVFGVGR